MEFENNFVEDPTYLREKKELLEKQRILNEKFGCNSLMGKSSHKNWKEWQEDDNTIPRYLMATGCNKHQK